jgi:hypothetical protein
MWTQYYANEIDRPTLVRVDETVIAPVPDGVETFSIPAENMASLEDKIAKLARKAARRGLEAIGIVRHAEQRSIWDNGRVYVRHTVSVHGAAPAQNGYAFVATLEHLGADGTIVRTVPNAPVADGELAAYRDATPRCDHCGLVRNRIDTFVVKHLESGALRQVGRNCLGDFLGSQDPETLALRAQWLVEARDACESEGFGDGAGLTDTFATDAFLRYVYAAIKTVGWTSRTAAREDWSKRATADLVLHEPSAACKADAPHYDHCADCRTLHSDAFRQRAASDACAAEVADALAWVASFADRDSLSDYEHNLLVACRSGVMTNRQAGLVASVIVAFAKHQEREVERARKAAQPKGTKHLGVEGKRGTFTLTVVGQREIEGHYGVTTVINFRDADNNLAVWFASGEFDDLRGQTLSVTGRVDVHQEYNGEPQTKLSRCKFTEVTA